MLQNMLVWIDCVLFDTDLGLMLCCSVSLGQHFLFQDLNTSSFVVLLQVVSVR